MRRPLPKRFDVESRKHRIVCHERELSPLRLGGEETIERVAMRMFDCTSELCLFAREIEQDEPLIAYGRWQVVSDLGDLWKLSNAVLCCDFKDRDRRDEELGI